MKNTRAWGGVVAGLVMTVVLTGCMPEPLAGSGGSGSGAGTAMPSATPSPTHSASAPTAMPSAPAADEHASTFVRIIDGDTIETAAGRVRIIGIDTPERQQCGYEEASMHIGRLIAVGDPLLLELPRGQNDTDNYGRLLRFVTTSSGVDVGLSQLEAGHAITRYDSSDGYPKHPREAKYRAAQIATTGPNGEVISAACASGADPDMGAAPPPPPAPETGERWWQQYSSCNKLKQNGVGHPTGPFSRDDPAQAEIYEWFAFGTGNRGDGDGDGLACEGR